MTNLIKIKGRFLFDPKDKTNKHKAQASWKKIAMIMFEGDLCEYYAWFIKKRYNLPLNKPLRGAHITFINDSLRDIGDGIKNWEKIKAQYDGKEVEVILSVDPRTDSDSPNSTNHWWLNIPEEYRKELHDIRKEIGLGRPFYGLHLSLGHANEKFKDHSKYIHRLIKKFGNNYK